MGDSRREVLKLLKDELAFLERGGYGGGSRSWKPLSIFLDSPSCPNRLDAQRDTPCGQCWLFNFIPRHYSRELPACHFIPLTADGQSVNSMSREYSTEEVRDKL